MPELFHFMNIIVYLCSHDEKDYILTTALDGNGQLS
jgi:hypothetical protein